MDFISTSNLANELEMKSSELFEKLKNLGWIEKKLDKSVLTEIGKQKGGQTRFSQKFGEYVVWPENIKIDSGPQANSKSKLLNATAIGKYFNISSKRLNLLINEFGWIEKTIAGWGITKMGRALGGKQFEHETSGSNYVLWPESILQNKDLLDLFQDTNSKKTSLQQEEYKPEKNLENATVEDFRKKYPAEYRTKDGHYVRSKAELTIDDSLYLWGIPHAYEKKLPNTPENVISDFYIPSGNNRKAVYIEYWGMEKDEKYNERKYKKIEIYNQLRLDLIQLTDSDIKNIEDSLQKYLLQHGITTN